MTSSISDIPKPTIFFNERFTAARHQKGCDEKTYLFMYFLLCKGYQAMTSEWQRAPYFRRNGEELGFKTGNFVNEKMGGLP